MVSRFITRRYAAVLLNIFTLALLLCALPAVHSCGGSAGQPELKSHAGQGPGLAQLADLPAPAGVDRALWESLKDALRGAADAAEQARQASAPPVWAPAAVSDLTLGVLAGGGLKFDWSYCNPGDYDRNGEVNVADLVPVGLYYGARAGDTDWAQASCADGDGNGEVNLADVTPLGANLQAVVDGYILQQAAQADAADAAWHEVARAALESWQLPEAGGAPRFILTLAVAQYDGYYRVVPFELGASTPYAALYTGVPSPALRLDQARGWPMPGGNAQHTGYSSGVGPSWGHIAWEWQLPEDVRTDYDSDVYDLAVGVDGSVYFDWTEDSGGTLCVVEPGGTASRTLRIVGDCGAPPVLAPDGTVHLCSTDGLLYAVRSDLSVAWTLQLEGDVSATPTVGPDGTVYVGGLDGYLYAVNADGTLRWKFKSGSYPPDRLPDNGPAMIIAPVALAADGTVYLKGRDQLLHALNPDGSEKWQVDLYDATSSLNDHDTPPVVTSDGTVYVGGSVLLAINPDGSEKWRTSDTSAVDCPALGQGGLVYVLLTSGPYAYGDVSLAVLHPADGAILWQQPFSPTSGPLLVDSQNKAYCFGRPAGVGDEKLTVFDGDGSLLWFAPENYANAPTPLALDATGDLYALSKESLIVYYGEGEPMPPLAPQHVDAYGDTEKITVSWGTVLRAESYDVYRDVQDAPVATGIEGNDWEDTQVDASAQHVYWVRAVNSYGVSDFSPSEVGFVKLLEPTNLAATQGTLAGRIAISWDAVPLAAGYRVYRDGESEAAVADLPADQTSYEDVVTDWDQHSYRIRAYNAWFETYANHYISGYAQRGAGDTGPGDWRMEAHDAQRTRCSPHLGPATSDLRWSRQIYSLSSEASFGDAGAIYLATYSAVNCLNSDGTQRWTGQKSGSSTYGSPVVGDDGAIYIMGSYDGMMVFNPDGTLRRQAAGMDAWHFTLGSGGVLYGVWKYGLAAYALAGNSLWRFVPDNDATQFEPIPSYVSAPAVSPAGTMYYSFHALEEASPAPYWLFAVAADGSELWRAALPDGPLSAPSIGASGALYMPVGPYSTSPGPPPPGPGKPGGPGAAAKRPSDVAVCSLVAFDASGGELWSYPVTGRIMSSPAIAPDGTLYLATAEGTLLALDAGGNLLWTDIADSCTATPVTDAAGSVYYGAETADNVGSVRALDSSGGLIWSLDLADAPQHLSIGNDGTLYVVAGSSLLYAIGPGTP